jgi:ABC-type lipoprotein release transport system permease subunit
MFLIKIAFRNLWRRKFRTILTLIALGISYGLLIFFEMFSVGSHEGMANTGIKLQAGHVVIQGKGYNDDKEIDINVKNPDKIQKAIKTISDVKIIYRIFTTGSLASPDGSVILDNLVGIQSNKEVKISDIPKKIIKGTYLQGNEGEIVIGKVAAKLLHVDIGHKVQLSVSDLHGNVSRVSLRVKGIFKTGGIDVDRGYSVINLSEAQKILKLGNAVSQIAIFGKFENSKKLTTLIKSKLNNPNLEILDWEDALPMLSQMLWLDSISMYVFMFIIFAIVAAGILNTILMSVMERTREFGIMKSIGMKPVTIFSLIMIEAVFIGIFSIIIGICIGVPLSYWMSKVGLDPAMITGGEAIEIAGVAISDRMYAKVQSSTVIWSGIVVMILTLISAISPALRAARIVPVKAIRES